MSVQRVQDNPAAQAGPAAKRSWQTPRLSRIRAGSAELNVGGTDDGVDRS
jgi:hypothetical protein